MTLITAVTASNRPVLRWLDVRQRCFFTIENVAMVDAQHIIVGNDNNLPFSAGRHLDKADDNEFILLKVPELLAAR